MHHKNNFNKLKLQIEQQAEQIALLENELLVTGNALQEKSDFANALEEDLEHAIYNLNKFTTANDPTHNTNYRVIMWGNNKRERQNYELPRPLA